MEYAIHRWCAAQTGRDVEAKFTGGSWTVTDYTSDRPRDRVLARGTAIEVLRVLRGLPGYRQPLERRSRRNDLVSAQLSAGLRKMYG